MGNISNNVIKGKAAQQDYAAKAFLLIPPVLREGFESLKPAEASKARSFFTVSWTAAFSPPPRVSAPKTV